LYSLLISLGGGGDSERVSKTSMGKTSMGKSSMGKSRMGNASMGKGSSNSPQGGSSSNMSNMGHGGLMDSDVMLVNDRGLDDMVDGVDLVGLRDGIGLGHLNGVGFGHVLLVDDFPFNGDGDGNGNFDFVFVDLKLGFDTFHLGSDDGVGSDRCSNFGDGNGVSRCRSLVGRCWRNSGIRCRCSRDDWWCNGHSGLGGLGGASHVSVGSGLAHALLLGVGDASLNSLGSHLDLTVTNDCVMGAGLDGASMDMFLHGVSNHLGSVANNCGSSAYNCAMSMYERGMRSMVMAQGDDMGVA